MSNILFGIDIAKLVNDSIAAAGGVLPGILVQKINTGRTAGDLTAGQNPTQTRHSFQGFIENRSQTRRAGTLVSQGGQIISILGDSLPSGIVPEQGDRIEIEGRTFDILEVPTRDPAAALYECVVESV